MTELHLLRGTDSRGIEIVYAYLARPETDECAPLATVHADIDGRSLAVNAGGPINDSRYCFGASFKAPLVVLTPDADEHELRITGDGTTIRARAVDLASPARLVASAGSPVVVALDRKIRGRPVEVQAIWSASEDATARIEGDRVLVDVPEKVKASPRAVLDVLVVYDLEVTACEGVPACRAEWLARDAFDLATGP